jgi:hypothetical protein
MDDKEYYTLMFVEQEQDIGKCITGFQLNRKNYLYSPKGTIRIARYKNSFNIKNHHSESYYADIYLKLFIRKWKRIYIINKTRNNEKKLAQLVLNRNKKIPRDIIKNISDML